VGLEPGVPGDTVEVEVDGIGRLSNTIAEAPAPTGCRFSPTVTATSLYVALGSDFNKLRDGDTLPTGEDYHRRLDELIAANAVQQPPGITPTRHHRRPHVRQDGKHVMKFTSPIRVGRLSFADDLQRCLAWSTALAAPQPATSVTLLLAILEAGTGTTAQRVLDDAGVTTHDLQPLEVAARAGQPAAKGLKRLARRVPGLTHSADLERALRRAANQMSLDKRSVLTSDDMFLALLTEDGPARDALVSLGKEPSAMRSKVMRSRPPPE